MQMTCQLCGRSFAAKSKRAKFCSDKCRMRNHYVGGSADKPNLRVVESPADERPRPDGSLLGSVLVTLSEAKALDSPAGRLAVSLATRLDDPNAMDSGSAVAALSRELRAVMAEATARAKSSTSPLALIREGLRVV